MKRMFKVWIKCFDTSGNTWSSETFEPLFVAGSRARIQSSLPSLHKFALAEWVIEEIEVHNTAHRLKAELLKRLETNEHQDQ